MEIERHPHGVLRLDAAYVLQEQPIAAPMSARAAEMRLGCGKLPATSVRVSLTQTPAIFKTMAQLYSQTKAVSLFHNKQSVILSGREINYVMLCYVHTFNLSFTHSQHAEKFLFSMLTK